MNIQQLQSLNVLVIGDSCEDIYHFGRAERISPEAPVPIFNLIESEYHAGMAANVKANLDSLGINNTLLTNTESIIKERYIDVRFKHHLLRVDRGETSSVVPLPTKDLIGCELTKYDGILIVDYDKGLITESNIKFLTSKFKKPIFVDSKKPDLSIFENCIIKINESENLKIKKYPSSCELVVTLGERGACWKNNIYPTESVEVFDVCGAGDTFFASFAAAYLLGDSIPAAIKFANRCATITVQKLGTYAPTLEELL